MLSFVERRKTAESLDMAWFLWVMNILFYHDDTALIVAFLYSIDLSEPVQNLSCSSVCKVKLMVHLFQ